MSTPAADHRQAAADHRARCAVLTVSDTRTPDTDVGGRLIREHLAQAGHDVVDHAIVRDESIAIDQQLQYWLTPPESAAPEAAAPPHAILTTGGTGVARRDTTIEVVEALIDKPLPGFGELFRVLSHQEIGAAAMLSRATAGLATAPQGDCFLFALPGSPHAVELALTQLILPELPHLVWERGR
ncbi:MAG: molybdenum cofactor biosynthesis protein B [Planctomycetota bacterium]